MKVFQNLRRMHGVTRGLMRWGLRIAAVMLFCAVLLLCAVRGNTDTYALFQTAGELVSGASAVLFIIVLGTALIEEQLLSK
ncbi:hypothetical protein LJC32_06655 [Oscillospiraceae bacterium OttesenSCG-928-F05]|nr:hypothetical protein [Oscillospiraceae bacterium OttesenSCG-928-F05]